MTPVLVCWDCGAANHRDDRKCWHCGRPDWKADAVSPSAVTVAEPTDSGAQTSSVSTNRKGRSLSWRGCLWCGSLLLGVLFPVILAIAIGAVLAIFLDKPGIPAHASMIGVIPWIVPPIAALYVVALMGIAGYRMLRRK